MRLYSVMLQEHSNTQKESHSEQREVGDTQQSVVRGSSEILVATMVQISNPRWGTSPDQPQILLSGGHHLLFTALQEHILEDSSFSFASLASSQVGFGKNVPPKKGFFKEGSTNLKLSHQSHVQKPHPRSFKTRFPDPLYLLTP